MTNIQSTRSKLLPLPLGPFPRKVLSKRWCSGEIPARWHAVGWGEEMCVRACDQLKHTAVGFPACFYRLELFFTRCNVGKSCRVFSDVSVDMWNIWCIYAFLLAHMFQNMRTYCSLNCFWYMQEVQKRNVASSSFTMCLWTSSCPRCRHGQC